jgi:hypothetical protein
MSQPKIACVNCKNWIPPKANYNTNEFIDASCKVDECCPTYVNRSKNDALLHTTRTHSSECSR